MRALVDSTRTPPERTELRARLTRHWEVLCALLGAPRPPDPVLPNAVPPDPVSPDAVSPDAVESPSTTGLPNAGTSPDAAGLPGAAGEVGAWLVAAGFTDPDALRRTVAVLGEGFAGVDAARMAEVLGALAAGYAAATRDRAAAELDEARAAHEQTAAELDQARAARDRVAAERDQARAAREQAAAERDEARAALVGVRRELRDSEARFQQVFASTGVGIAVFELDGSVREVNPALRRMLGGDDAIPARLFESGELAALRTAWTSSEQAVARVERQFTGPLGDPVWTNATLSLVLDADGRPAQRVAVVEDVTEQRVLRDYLRHQALHDVLTGLPNRQSFLPRLEEALNKPGSITLCYLDVDSVAIVNDGLGYEAGDELLRVVARRLRDVVAEENATVARIGGDEFVVLIEDTPDTPSISALADAIDRELSEPVYLSGHGVGVSAGMGFVRTSAREPDAMTLLRQAHSTLRRAESGGKGQWGIYDAGEDARDRTRLALIATMPGALENGEIAIDYRPLEPAGGGTPVAFAARLRWDEAEFGVVDHEACLDFADTLGLSGHLGEWLLEEACAFAAAEGVPVAVRLSADQSRDPDLAAVVADALRRSGLPAERLWLSLDSGCLASGLDVVEDNLTTLADMGVRRLLHGFTCALPELALVSAQALHGVELAATPDEPPARQALAALLPLLKSTGALVVGDAPGTDLVLRR
ncbi:diguanylate cyclase domain-containing protein [Saccharothrix obliqua]|uniref:diguanylate cyclase domain-containing protein n=1 Tax=Saccharothrix obliqua TaxID=2861747 RepID=UPI0027E21C99|nr:diguanylate cyclase [Saccharothrix obliqua]